MGTAPVPGNGSLALFHSRLLKIKVFYGTAGNLYAICPVFDVFPPSGKETNFVYSLLHPSAEAYDPHPKAEGIAFGGNCGNERGYLPVEGLISEVEVWGLGGSKAKHIQASYKKREDHFTTQRRTVTSLVKFRRLLFHGRATDWQVVLKSFSNWEDSPEKMMMDMRGDPNKVRREDR